MDTPFRTCLLIDDSPLDNFINSMIIRRGNFASEILVSEDPKAALSLLEEGALYPDVIFLDIRMPVMDGFEFLGEYDKIEIDKDRIKIFMLSSSIDPADIDMANNNKYVTRYLTKSLTPETLLELAGI